MEKTQPLALPLTDLSQTDCLTGLCNHVLFQDRLGHAIQRAERNKSQMALLFLNIDRFKQFNDSFGYNAGDELLKTVAMRIVGCLRESDTVARFGGDRYTILLEGFDRTMHTTSVIQRILKVLELPFLWVKQELFLTASIGISVFPFDGFTPATLIKNAESALDHAKENGLNTFRFYAPNMNARALARLKMDAELHHALSNEEFVLYYQPLMNANGTKAIGLEALVRWRHPDRGLVPPVQFIPLLEETGLIVPVGEWILKTACIEAVKIQHSGGSNIYFSVNISTRQFQQPGFVDILTGILLETGIDASILQLEITESMLMKNTKSSIKTLKAIADLGVGLWIDDFGTGYSSLAYLKQLPVNGLKIDRSFIMGIPDDSGDVAITSAILALADKLGLKVVAEGVETEAQMGFLKRHGCHALQGFLFARPMPDDQLESWLQSAPCLMT